MFQILDAVHMEEEFEAVAEKLKKVILPRYIKNSSKSTSHGTYMYDKLEVLLKEVMPQMLLSGNKDDVSCWHL